MKTLLGLVCLYALVGACGDRVESPKVRGDLDGDGHVTMADARIAQDCVLAGLECPDADVSGDGTVSAYDAALIMRMAEDAE